MQRPYCAPKFRKPPAKSAMTRIVRTLKTHSSIAVGAVAIWGLFELVALSRTQAKRARQC